MQVIVSDSKLNADSQAQENSGLENVASELTSLLSLIARNASLGQKEVPASSAAHLNFKQVKAAAEKGSRLVDQLVFCSGKAQLTFKKISINTLFDEVADRLEGSLPRNIDLRINQIVGLPSISADLKHLSDAIICIVKNAREAISTNDGVISISAGAMNYVANSKAPDELFSGRYIFIKISDTGPGIHEDIQSQIFTPFFTTKLTHPGMGLTVAKAIISQHSGKMLIKSSVGSGTTVTLLFSILE